MRERFRRSVRSLDGIPDDLRRISLEHEPTAEHEHEEDEEKVDYGLTMPTGWEELISTRYKVM